MLKYGSLLATPLPDFSSRFLSDSGQAFKIDTNTGTVQFGSPIQGSGNSLEKFGSGTLVLNSGNSTYSGATTVHEGTLRLPNITGTPQALPSGTSIFIDSNAILDVDDTVVVGSLAGASGAEVDIQGSNSFTVGGNVVGSSSTTYEGELTGSGSLLNKGRVI